MSRALAPALHQGLSALGLSLSELQQEQLLAYLALLLKWNKVYNLTSVRDPDQMLAQHLLDCLAIIGPLHQRAPELKTLLDVGAGGGLPAVVVAIACPQVRVTAVDSVAKKAAFIQTAAHALSLANLQGVHSRVEDVRGPFEVITSRAFASLADFVSGSRAALQSGGVWMAMKGKHPLGELAALAPDIEVELVQTLLVPGLAAERCLVWMKPRSFFAGSSV